eukprot:670857-Prorocentrum_minimum.AAC.4
MASGFGTKGGKQGRCFSLWMDFSESCPFQNPSDVKQIPVRLAPWFFSCETTDRGGCAKKKSNHEPLLVADTSEPNKCFAKRDDYLECLHHRKEVTEQLSNIGRHTNLTFTPAFIPPTLHPAFG